MNHSSRTKKIKILKKGDILGDISFFSDRTAELTAKSLNVINLVYLSKEDFLRVISKYPIDQEKYF